MLSPNAHSAFYYCLCKLCSSGSFLAKNAVKRCAAEFITAVMHLPTEHAPISSSGKLNTTSSSVNGLHVVDKPMEAHVQLALALQLRWLLLTTIHCTLCQAGARIAASTYDNKDGSCKTNICWEICNLLPGTHRSARSAMHPSLT